MILQKLTAKRVHRNNWAFRGRCIEWQFSPNHDVFTLFSLPLLSAFFFFFLEGESKIGVLIIHGCAFYTGKYGNCRDHTLFVILSTNKLVISTWKWVLASARDPYFEFTIAKFSFTSTGRDFDSMYSESFSFASTAKWNSMNYLPQWAEVLTHRSLQSFLSPQRASVTRWLNYLPQRAEILTHRSLQSFLSPQRANATWWLNYLPQRAEILIHRSLQSFLSPQRANVTQWLNYLPQRAEILTHRSNSTPPTCEEYCEWFPSCGTEVAFAFNIKQVSFKFSSVISRDQQAAVGSLLRV